MVGDPVLAKFQTHPDQAAADYHTVCLYVLYTKPPTSKCIGKAAGSPPRIFGTGLEVDTDDQPTQTILNSDIISYNGKVCIIQVGGVTHQVVLHKSTPVGTTTTAMKQKKKK